MLEERLDCVFILSRENSFTDSLSCEEAIKWFAAKKTVTKKYYRRSSVRKLIKKHCFIYPNFVTFVVFLDFSNLLAPEFYI
jgi:hypothetical protein